MGRRRRFQAGCLEHTAKDPGEGMSTISYRAGAFLTIPLKIAGLTLQGQSQNPSGSCGLSGGFFFASLGGMRSFEVVLGGLWGTLLGYSGG